MSDNYRLTVKFAPPGTSYRDGKSTWGHVWLEARKPGDPLDGKPSFNGGWSTGSNIYRGGENNFSPYDWKDYKGRNVSSVTVEISKTQFEQLNKYPNLAASGKIPGFRSVYDAGDNSCIDFSGKGLEYIGLAGKNFDGSGLFWARPEKQVNAFLEQIAKYRAQGAALTVEHRGRTYKFDENERDVRKFWKEVDPYWYLSENRQHQEQQTQHAQTRSLTFDDMPPLARELCQKCRVKLEAYYQKHNIGYRQDDLERAALAAGVAAYGEKMTDLTMLNIKDGNIYVGHKTPQGVLNYASVNEQAAIATPEQDSIAQSKQAEIKLEEMERRREMEILAYQQSQSMGRSI